MVVVAEKTCSCELCDNACLFGSIYMYVLLCMDGYKGDRGPEEGGKRTFLNSSASSHR